MFFFVIFTCFLLCFLYLFPFISIFSLNFSFLSLSISRLLPLSIFIPGLCCHVSLATVAMSELNIIIKALEDFSLVRARAQYICYSWLYVVLPALRQAMTTAWIP
uniref:Uncharacterized protein n=1 Tax=Rhipicephalus pulchellus TaxID=72859 RepID=L7LWF4_RHIPC